MKKKALIFILSLLSTSFYGADIRMMWFDLDDKNKKREFIETVNKENSQSPSTQAYKAAAIMMKAEFTSLPNEKLIFFNQGKEQLEKCLSQNSWNTECRFIRLTLQCKSPWFLGYHDNIEIDAQVIIDHLKLKYINAQNPYWKKAIAFMRLQSNISNNIKKQLVQYQS